MLSLKLFLLYFYYHMVLLISNMSWISGSSFAFFKAYVQWENFYQNCSFVLECIANIRNRNYSFVIFPALKAQDFWLPSKDYHFYHFESVLVSWVIKSSMLPDCIKFIAQSNFSSHIEFIKDKFMKLIY